MRFMIEFENTMKVIVTIITAYLTIDFEKDKGHVAEITKI